MERLEADLQARLKIEAEQVLDELRKVAVFNLADVLVIQDNGTARLDLTEADAAHLAALSEVQIEERIIKGKDGAPDEVLRTVAYLGSSTDSNALTFVRATQADTDRAGLRLIVRLIEGPTKIDAAVFEAMRREGAEAVIVQPIFTGHQEQIVTLANEAGLPVIADNAVFAEAGAVFAYGPNNNATAYRAAYYVDRILKGARPTDLPIEQPTETRFTVNIGALKRFGWTLPPSLLAFADEVID